MKLLPFLFALAPLLSLQAADPATQLADRGKVLLSEDFSKHDPKAWPASKGKWESSEGALHGSELAADMHPGVCRHTQDLTDAIVQYDVKLDGAKVTTLSFNSAKGHNCRVIITPTGFNALKDDSDHEGPDKGVQFGHQDMAFKSSEWHTVLAEIVGDTMVVTVDGAKPIAGSHEALKQTRNNFGFTVSGESVAIRNLKVWEAKPKANADALKAKLISATPKTTAATEGKATVKAAKGKAKKGGAPE